MNQRLETILNFIEQSKNLNADEKNNISKAVKEADKELATKNRDLEIESSLERVRAMALSMKKPDDLLSICKILFAELHSLGFSELRNAMINIHDDDDGTFLNYDFSDAAGATITTIFYNSHPATENLVKQIRKENDAFAEFVIRGSELDKWREYRKKMGEEDDPQLDNVSALYYYFYSIGIGGIGISTYGSITEEKRNVLKRFRNVFDLAYRRYIDVTQAEAQAQEAKIETSLERVRAQAMSMRKSDELMGVNEIMFAELKSLGFTELRNTEIIINNETKESVLSYYFSDYGVTGIIEVFYNNHPKVKAWAEEMQKVNDAFTSIVISENEIDEWRTYREEIGYLPDPKLDKATSVNYYSYSIGLGALSISSFTPIAEEQLKILERFRNVFGLAYRRYADVAQAEAQAREAQIELALERVRARSMAMHSSEELVDASTVLFNELKSLGIEAIRTGVGIIDELNETVEIWSSQLIEEKRNKILGLVPFKAHPFFEGYYESWKKKEPYFYYEISGNEVKKYYKAMSSILSYTEKKEFNSKEYFYTFFFSEGSFNVVSQNTLTEDECNLMIRFARVFGLIYRRFLDLKQAEAQARESQIEASLERVRSNAMAMHSSEDLSATVNVFFKELKSLGVLPWRCGVGQIDEETHTTNLTTTSVTKQGDSFEVTGKLKQEGHPVLEGIYDNWKLQKEYFPVLKGKEIKAYYDVVKPQIAYPDYPLDAVQYGHMIYFKEGFVFAWTEKELSESELGIFRRFTSVLSLTYRRFLDLKEAEAQAREAQIEAALEKVRGRAMAMHNSSDLSATASMVFTELRKLGINPKRCGVALLSKDSRTAQLYVATTSSESDALALIGSLDMTAHPCLEMQYESWLKNEIYFPVLNGEELKSYYEELSSRLSVPSLTDEQFQHEEYGYYLPFSEGSFYAWAEKPYSENEINILNRFKAIIDLTFRRYLDLQKAEAQAREAKIETALERVRSRTMAMHHSDELAETAAILFQQMTGLGIAPVRLYIGIIRDVTGEIEFWATDEGGNQISTRFTGKIDEPTTLSKMYASWQAQKKSLTIDQYGKDLADYIRYLSEELYVPFKEEFSHTRRVQSIAYFSKGLVGIATLESQPQETINLLERFAGVFDLTYTRFLDLKQAEQQTHKAQIEVALERVRARALAMQEPEELIEVAQVLRHEMGLLGVEELETGTIFTLDESSDRVECWFAIKDTRQTEKRLVSDHITLDLNQTWVGREMRKFYASDEKQISIPMKGTHRREWIEYCYSLSSELKDFYGDNIPDRTYHLYKSSDGVIGAASPGNLSEESWDLLKRAASVFSLAYSRFKDLTKARIDLKQLKEEKKRSESLLLNILPEEIADELKQFGKSYARKHEQVSILFADIKGFSSIAENLSANELVTQLDECFRAFDNIVEKHGMEKIKTIGDAYICACGLPKPVTDNAIKTVIAALDMLDFIKGFGLTKKIQNLPAFEFRVGIHTGPVVTGVVGLKKFTYDIWGDAVNMAARMEQHGEAGKINISGNTYQLIKDKFTCTYRGKIQAKNKGEVDMYFVECIS